MKPGSMLREPGQSGSKHLFDYLLRARNDTDTVRGGWRVGCQLRNSISILRTLLQQRRTTGQSKFARILVGPDSLTAFPHPLIISAFARIENHYFVNDAFMRDGQLLDSQEIDKM